MSNNELLIHGTSGCKLLADGVDVGWPSEFTATAWWAGATGISLKFEALGLKLSADEIIQLLSMEFANPASEVPTKTTLKAGSAISAGNHLGLVYNQFEFQNFDYDWRSDIRHTGSLLLDRLKNKPADGRWRVVAHSQGGLAVVVASKLYAAEHGDSDVAFPQVLAGSAPVTRRLSFSARCCARGPRSISRRFTLESRARRW